MRFLVAVAYGIAAGVITQPAQIAAGSWIITVQDLSNFHASGPIKLAGTVYVSIAVYVVP